MSASLPALARSSRETWAGSRRSIAPSAASTRLSVAASDVGELELAKGTEPKGNWASRNADECCSDGGSRRGEPP